MTLPPLKGRGLRPPGGRVLPCFLPAQRCQVQQLPDGAKRLNTAAIREVRTVNAFTVPEEYTESECFPFVRGPSEIFVEIGFKGRDPRYGPAHPFLIFPDIGQRVIAFSFLSNFFRAACHSPGQTIGEIDLLRFVLIF